MRRLGIAKSSYYAHATKQRLKDERNIATLTAVHLEHPFYGVRRLSLHLSWSPNKTRRLRSMAGLTIARPGKKRRGGNTTVAEIAAAPNALKRFAVLRNESRPQAGMDYSAMTESGAWVQDFTHLNFGGEDYFAVVLDLKTRQVLGWQLSTRHSSNLTHAALCNALARHPPPTILHSDQGSEYLSYKHQLVCDKQGIILSCSTKSSPWQNGFMERFFGTFKLEFGTPSRFNNLGELYEAIAHHIHYYNTKRIHSALKMSPAAYAASLKNIQEQSQTQHMISDKVSEELGA